MNKKIIIAKSLGVIVSLSGLVVMAGWILDIGALKSILPIWVTMKFITAISFFLSGISLYCISCAREENAQAAQIVLSITTLCLLLIMSALLASSFLGVYTGIEELFIKEAQGAAKTAVAGRPAIPTMVEFILIGLAGAFSLIGRKTMTVLLKATGWIIVGVAGIAVTGYLINQPVLYYDIRPFTGAMACHTAILFVLWGLGLYLAEK
jgi:hypothetical protein